ncbi:MAG: SRPBCC domain-containing protein [Chitinophagales bacterium]|nr:SRPBCC domain-containing protein [Chitinophagales bacterium]
MKDYKKYFFVPEEREIVYKALTTQKTINLWTGEEALMIAEPNTEFEIFSGAIVGKNLEFEENKKIVQQWYFGDEEPVSIVTLKLHDQKNGTSIELLHTNIPGEAYKDIVDGWNDTYFAALIDFYN